MEGGTARGVTRLAGEVLGDEGGSEGKEIKEMREVRRGGVGNRKRYAHAWGGSYGENWTHLPPTHSLTSSHTQTVTPAIPRPRLLRFTFYTFFYAGGVGRGARAGRRAADRCPSSPQRTWCRPCEQQASAMRSLRAFRTVCSSWATAWPTTRRAWTTRRTSRPCARKCVLLGG